MRVQNICHPSRLSYCRTAYIQPLTVQQFVHHDDDDDDDDDDVRGYLRDGCSGTRHTSAL